MTADRTAPDGNTVSLLSDMNLTPRWVPVLIAAEFDAEHWTDLGPVDAPDHDLMAHARTRGMVVLISGQSWPLAAGTGPPSCRSGPPTCAPKPSPAR